MRIQDMGLNDVIQCKTFEENKELMKIFDSLGLKWISGYSYATVPERWNVYKQETCYRPKEGTYCNLRYYQETGCNIHQASDFIYPITQKTTYKVFGREFEERMDAEEFREKVIKFHNAKSPEEIAELL